MSERLLEQWRHFNFNPTFYDPRWFTGWPVFHFYAFLCHLLTALLGLVLGVVSEAPVRLAAHLVLVIGSALLPWSVFYFASPLLSQLCTGDTPRERGLRWVLALSAVTLSFWFLNHDRQWHGVGAASVMNIGLFSQLLGWHFLLINIGALFRFLNRKPGTSSWFVSLSFALLFLSHSLTAIYGAFLGLLSFFWFHRHRLAIAKAYLLGVGLCAFWLVPFLAYSSTYVGLDIHRPSGDFLEIFLRYPLHGLFRTFNTWLAGDFKAIEFTNLVMLFLLVSAFANLRLRSSAWFIAFGVFVLTGIVVFSSGFISTSIPLGIHYYRFPAYAMLLVVALFCVVPLSFLTGEPSRHRLVRHLPLAAVVGILVACLVSTYSFPHYERKKVARNATNRHLAQEEQVLDYLAAQEVRGRVLFGYFNNYKRFAFLGPHYMESKLFARTGRETVNGLFIQSSLAYRMPIASANQLQVKTYNIPLLFTDKSRLDDDTRIQQLREFGVTHIVTGPKKKTIDSLRPHALGELKRIGPYTIVAIAVEEFPIVQQPTKELIGYVDRRGNLPFKFIEMYFYGRERLTSNFELIALHPDEPVPAGISTVVVNGEADETADQPVRRRYPAATEDRRARLPQSLSDRSLQGVVSAQR